MRRLWKKNSFRSLVRKFQDMKSKQEKRKIFAMPIYSAEVHDNTQHEAAASKLTNLCPARPWRVFFLFWCSDVFICFGTILRRLTDPTWHRVWDMCLPVEHCPWSLFLRLNWHSIGRSSALDVKTSKQETDNSTKKLLTFHFTLCDLYKLLPCCCEGRDQSSPVWLNNTPADFTDCVLDCRANLWNQRLWRLIGGASGTRAPVLGSNADSSAISRLPWVLR